MFSLYLLCQIILTLVCRTLSYEPPKDLDCFNDYESEMKCSFPSDNVRNCSAYNLNIIHKVIDKINTYTCIFNRSHHDASCECKFEVQGFVIEENFSITLLEGTKELSSKEFKTRDCIKPKAPVLFLQETENGNFNVTWNDKYKKKGVFTSDLQINLTYGIKGKYETISRNVQNTIGFYEIVGSNLQPKTEYILTAKMSTDYNDHKIYSDQSEPIHFTTAPSPNEIVKLVVPPLCIGLFIIICIIFICFLRVKAHWWDKIPKPRLGGNFEKAKDHILPPSLNAFNPICVEIPKLDPEEGQKLIPAKIVDTSKDSSFHSIESSPVDYGQAVPDFVSENNNMNKMQIAMAIDLAQIMSIKSMPTTMEYNSVDEASSKERHRANRDSGNGSGSSVFSNLSYLGSGTDNSSFLDRTSCDHPANQKASDSGCNSVDIIPTENTLGEEYQSFNTVLEKGNDADDKFIRKNLITSANPLYPPLPHHDHMVPSDDPYQAFQDVSKNTEGQRSMSITTEQALNECGALKFPQCSGQDAALQHNTWAAFLHTPPVIEIDCSYHAV